MQETFEITVVKADKTLTVDWSKVAEAGKEYVIRYGLKQSLNDSCASAEDEADAVKKSADRLAAILAGTVREGGGGGAALSPMETATRAIVVDYLRSIGTKKAEAVKLARTPQDAFKTVLVTKLKAAKKPAGKDAVDAAFTANWPKVEAQAKAIADLAKTTPTVEV